MEIKIIDSSEEKAVVVQTYDKVTVESVIVDKNKQSEDIEVYQTHVAVNFNLIKGGSVVSNVVRSFFFNEAREQKIESNDVDVVSIESMVLALKIKVEEEYITNL